MLNAARATGGGASLEAHPELTSRLMLLVDIRAHESEGPHKGCRDKLRRHATVVMQASDSRCRSARSSQRRLCQGVHSGLGQLRAASRGGCTCNYWLKMFCVEVIIIDVVIMPNNPIFDCERLSQFFCIFAACEYHPYSKQHTLHREVVTRHRLMSSHQASHIGHHSDHSVLHNYCSSVFLCTLSHGRACFSPSFRRP